MVYLGTVGLYAVLVVEVNTAIKTVELFVCYCSVDCLLAYALPFACSCARGCHWLFTSRVLCARRCAVVLWLLVARVLVRVVLCVCACCGCRLRVVCGGVARGLGRVGVGVGVIPCPCPCRCTPGCAVGGVRPGCWPVPLGYQMAGAHPPHLKAHHVL